MSILLLQHKQNILWQLQHYAEENPPHFSFPLKEISVCVCVCACSIAFLFLSIKGNYVS